MYVRTGPYIPIHINIHVSLTPPPSYSKSGGNAAVHSRHIKLRNLPTSNLCGQVSDTCIHIYNVYTLENPYEVAKYCKCKSLLTREGYVYIYM